jgi:hypothetical protein
MLYEQTYLRPFQNSENNLNKFTQTGTGQWKKRDYRLQDVQGNFESFSGK